MFPSFVEAESSDLYVVPRFRTAFVSPFSDIPTLCLLCSFFDKDGRPFDCSPEQTLHRAAAAFTEATGMTYEAMGELEYYVIAEDDEMSPPSTSAATTSRARSPSSTSSARSAWPT